VFFLITPFWTALSIFLIESLISVSAVLSFVSIAFRLFLTKVLIVVLTSLFLAAFLADFFSAFRADLVCGIF